MKPTLDHDDLLLVIKCVLRGWLRQGQIIIATPWGESILTGERNTSAKLYVKRIVSSPNSTHITYLHNLTPERRSNHIHLYDAEGKKIWRIPPKHFFVKGDDPEGGDDSLTWGPIPQEDIIGIVIFRISKSNFRYGL